MGNGISSEDAEKRYREMCNAVTENERLRKKAKQYKKAIKKGTFVCIINWHSIIQDINLNILKTTLCDDLKEKFLENYMIIDLNLDLIVNNMCDNANKVFPKENMWKNRTDENITRLIETVESNIKIIPPIIKFSTDKSIAILDGNHRIALSRFLKLEEIPFLILKSEHLKFLEINKKNDT